MPPISDWGLFTFNEIKPVTLEDITTVIEVKNNKNSGSSIKNNFIEDNSTNKKQKQNDDNKDKPDFKYKGEVITLFLFLFISVPYAVHSFIVRVLNSGRGGKKYRYLHTIVWGILKRIRLKLKKVPKKENNN